MICKKCGKPLSSAQRKCPACGSRMESPSACGGFDGLAPTLSAAFQQPSDQGGSPSPDTTPRRLAKRSGPPWPLLLLGVILAAVLTLVLLLVLWPNLHFGGADPSGHTYDSAHDTESLTDLSPSSSEEKALVGVAEGFVKDAAAAFQRALPVASQRHVDGDDTADADSPAPTESSEVRDAQTG